MLATIMFLIWCWAFFALTEQILAALVIMVWIAWRISSYPFIEPFRIIRQRRARERAAAIQISSDREARHRERIRQLDRLLGLRPKH